MCGDNILYLYFHSRLLCFVYAVTPCSWLTSQRQHKIDILLENWGQIKRLCLERQAQKAFIYLFISLFIQLAFNECPGHTRHGAALHTSSYNALTAVLRQGLTYG